MIVKATSQKIGVDHADKYLHDGTIDGFVVTGVLVAAAAASATARTRSHLQGTGASRHEPGRGAEATGALMRETLWSELVAQIIGDADPGSMASKTPLTVHLLTGGCGRSCQARANNGSRLLVGACRLGGVLSDPASMPMWNGWGNDAANMRFQNAKAAGLTAADVPKLTLKWAFGFRGDLAASGTAHRARAACSSAISTACAFARREDRLIDWTFKADGGVRMTSTVARVPASAH